jgi:hypothetical protein
MRSRLALRPPHPRRMNSRLGRHEVRLRGLLPRLVGAILVLAAPLSAQEEGLLELRLTAVAATRTVPVLLDAGGEPLVPLRAALDFLEIPAVEDGEALVLEWPPGAWSTRVDLAARTVASGGATYTAPAEEWVVRGAEAFVSVAALERILGGQVRVDWENLGLIVAGRDDYPIVRRIRNAERRIAPGRSRLAEDEALDVAYPARSGGATLGWGLSVALAGDEVTGTGRAALGAAVLGGALEAGATARLDAGASRLADPYARYSRSFPRGRWVRQVELGDVQGDGLVVRPYFGASVSNEPLYAPRYFGEALVRPVLPAGWEYEVYEGDHLVGVSARGAQEGVQTPIGYGVTPLRIRMLGPAGQERVEEVVFLVPAVQVPAGEWRYTLGGGVCRRAGCDAIAHADLRYGVARSLTAGVGVDHTAGDSTGATRPYGSLAYTPAASLRTELRVRPGALLHGTVQHYHPLGGWRVAGGWTREEGGYRLPVPTLFGEANASVGTPLPGRGRVLSLYARARHSDSLATARWQAGLASGYRALHLGASYERGYQLQDVLSLTAGAPLPRHWLPTLRNPQVNARVDLAGSALHGVALGTTFRPADRASVSAAVTWYAGGGPPGLALSVVTRTPAAYLQTHTFREQGRTGGYASAGGGLAFGNTGGVVASPFETLGRSGVTGVVFLDDDGDGLWGRHEEPARGVPVIVGGERAVSDERGVYRAWGLLPYRVVALAVDTLSMETTTLSAGRPEYLVRPTPNVYARQDLPLLRTREAAGRLRWEGAAATLGGVTVEARPAAGEGVHRTVTFSDGEYYFPRLPAGEYTVSVAESSLRALGATVEPARLSVPGTAGAATVAAPVLVLRRVP